MKSQWVTHVSELAALGRNNNGFALARQGVRITG